MSFADNIKRRRLQLGLSLQQLADRCGVSASMLSAVERGARSPTLRVVTQIVEGLGASLTELLEDAPEPPLLVRHRPDAAFRDEGSGTERWGLSPRLVGHGVETSWYRLPPGAEAGPFRPHPATTYEEVVVVRGRIVVRVGEDEHTLGRGDALTYRADVEHGFRNPGRAAAEYVHVAVKTRE